MCTLQHVQSHATNFSIERVWLLHCNVWLRIFFKLDKKNQRIV